MTNTERINKAEEVLRKRYGSEPPAKVLSRFNEEKERFKDSAYLRHWEFFGSVNRMAWERGEHICMKVICASLIAWLLDASLVNPLPPHERCPHCGKVIFHNEVNDGWDIPQRTCSCGADFIRDGHNLPVDPAESVDYPRNIIMVAPLELREEITQLFHDTYSDEQLREKLGQKPDSDCFGKEATIKDLFGYWYQKFETELWEHEARFLFYYVPEWGKMTAIRTEIGLPEHFPLETSMNSLLDKLHFAKKTNNHIFTDCLRALSFSLKDKTRQVTKAEDCPYGREEVLQEILGYFNEEALAKQSNVLETTRVILNSSAWHWGHLEWFWNTLLENGVPPKYLKKVKKMGFVLPKAYLIEYLIGMLAE